MTFQVLALLLAAGGSQAESTQPPAEVLLVDRSFASTLAELEKSPRVRVETIGRTHLGRPVQLIIVALPEVIADLETHRQRAVTLSVPRIDHTALGSIDIQEEDLTGLARTAYLPVLFAGD